MWDNGGFRTPYNTEFEFYVFVKNGDVNKVKEFCNDKFSEKKGFGKLSDNSLQNLKYHFAIIAAMIARYCIEGGMPHETAYTLSDLYIYKADKCISEDMISDLHTEMTIDYTKRMNSMKKTKYTQSLLLCV